MHILALGPWASKRGTNRRPVCHLSGSIYLGQNVVQLFSEIQVSAQISKQGKRKRVSERRTTNANVVNEYRWVERVQIQSMKREDRRKGPTYDQYLTSSRSGDRATGSRGSNGSRAVGFGWVRFRTNGNGWVRLRTSGDGWVGLRATGDGRVGLRTNGDGWVRSRTTGDGRVRAILGGDWVERDGGSATTVCWDSDTVATPPLGGLGRGWT